jgi:hypothetical protein
MNVIQDPIGGEKLDAISTMYPSYLNAVSGKKIFSGELATYYGYVVSGQAKLSNKNIEITVKEGIFFCWPDFLEINTDGLVIVMCRIGFRGILTMGCIENVGRLSYIDGCSSSILVSPPRVGDPVLNHLHFPPETLQTEHTHPSIRFGVVAQGYGIAFGSNPSGSSPWEKEIKKGTVFFLNAHERHAFQTIGCSEGLDIISYHPDSDWGPTDQNHPMLTRTYLTGKSKSVFNV